MIRIEGYLIGASPKEVRGARSLKKERILFGSKKGKNELHFIFGWGGFEVFKSETEVKETILRFPKNDGYTEIVPVKISMKIPESRDELRKFQKKKKGSFVIIYAPLPQDRQVLGPFKNDLSEALDGRAGHFMGNGWVTFRFFEEASFLASNLIKENRNVRLAFLRLFNLKGKELTKPEEAEFNLEEEEKLAEV
ncbi:MAG: hypothetical protein WC435_03825 [Candidatus Paceibacterota bacterium]